MSLSDVDGRCAQGRLLEQDSGVSAREEYQRPEAVWRGNRRRHEDRRSTESGHADDATPGSQSIAANEHIADDAADAVCARANNVWQRGEHERSGGEPTSLDQIGLQPG